MAISDLVSSFGSSAIGGLKSQTSKIFGVSSGGGDTSTSPYLTNPNFLVTITQVPEKGPPIIVSATSPDEFSFSQSANWGTPFAFNLLKDGLLSDVYSAVSGKRLISQVSTLKVWQGGQDNTEFSLTLLFHAWSDTTNDVLNPVYAIMGMTMPTLTENGFLRSPGPYLSDAGVKEVSGAIIGGVAEAGQKAFNAIDSLLSKGVVNAAGGALGSLASKAKESGQAALDGFNSAIGSPDNSVKNGVNFVGGKLTDGASTLVSKATGLGDDIGLKNGNTLTKSLASKLRNTITVKIGKWFELNNCVINSVQLTAKPQTVYSKNGALTMVTAAITFSPVSMLTAEDIKDILKRT